MNDQVPPPSTHAAPFQRFTVRLVDGRFVRVPKSDLPSVEAQVDKTLTSNQTEIRQLCRLVNGHFVVTRPDRPGPPVSPKIPLPAQHGSDPTFALPDDLPT